jgi:phospholipase C
MSHFMHHNNAETIFNRLEAHGKTWKIYVHEPDPISFTGVIHMSRLREHFATHFVPYSEFERDTAEGTLPNFSLIEPNLLAGHGDYHPAFGRALLPGVEVDIDPVSSILAGEAFLARIYNAIKLAPISGGSNIYNTTLFIGWDEPGGTYDHVPPGLVPPPDAAIPKGMPTFEFDRSGYRVPALVVSPWIPEHSVFTDEYRHTSMIATLRKVWHLGEPFSMRDAAARTFDHIYTLDQPREVAVWPEVAPLPVSAFQQHWATERGAISTLGRHVCHGLLLHAEKLAKGIPSAPADPDAEVSPATALDIVHRISARLFPRLIPSNAPGVPCD